MSVLSFLDISEVMIAKARRMRLEGLVEFRVADVFSLPFGDYSYDLSLFESVITTLPGDKH